jgi:hypothetical protein
MAALAKDYVMRPDNVVKFRFISPYSTEGIGIDSAIYRALSL